MECAQYRRRRCLFSSVVIILIIIVVAVVLGLTLRKKTDGLKPAFIAKCEAFKGERYDCQTVWGAFEQAYVGQDPCKVPMEAYDPLIAAAPFKHACNRMMFWSKTKHVVDDFNKKKDCFITMQDTLLGSVLDDLTWCGKEGSSETFTTGCPGRTDCENNRVRSFLNKTSAAFADNACGDVTAMLNGSIITPFNSSSIFGSIEVKQFKSPTVKSLTVVLVTQKNSGTNCTNASLKDLQKELDKGIKYNCKEVTEAQIQECSSDPEKPCSSCW